MTICENIGKFQTTVQHRFMFGTTKRKVELDVMWVSCGYYSITATRIEEPGDNKWVEPKTDFQISLAPEWIEKTAELYPSAERRPRNELYKPFYEDFHTDASMIDMGHDTLFQVFKDQLEERVILTTYHFTYGVPTGTVSVFNITFEDFKAFKAFLDEHISEIFYSGVQISWPALVPEKPEQKEET